MGSSQREYKNLMRVGISQARWCRGGLSVSYLIIGSREPGGSS
jgi:hypothetical protein